MKQILFFSIMFLASASIINSQNYWNNQVSGTNANLSSIHFCDLNNGWAVANGGVIIHTINSGNTWSSLTSGIITDLNGVFFINSQVGWAVGTGGVIIKTIDGGTSWSPQTSNTTQILYSVKFVNDTVGWVVGMNDAILRTTNGGTTWTDQTCPVLPNLMALSVLNKDTAFASGHSGPSVGRIIKTVNGGTTWISQTISSGTVYGIYFTDANKGWAVGNNGTIINTINGGTNWTTQMSNTSDNLLSVCFINDTIGWAVGMNGAMVYTEDGGTTWTVNTSGNTVNLRNIYFRNPYRGWICGNAGKIMYHRTSEEICLVTVDTISFKNRIIWERILNQGTSYYKTYKFVTGNVWDSIGFVPFVNMSEFTDYNSNPGTQSERYKISAVDSLSNESDLSPYHQTILLQISVGVPTTTMNLSWSQYLDESGVFIPSSYTIIRGTASTNLTDYYTLPSSNTLYNDLNITSQYYYRVYVNKPTPCYPSSSAKANGGPYSHAHSNMEDVESTWHIIQTIADKGFSIYPNPMKESSLINWDGSMGHNCTIIIYDITGKVVLQENINNGSYTLNQDNIKNGFYTVEVRGEKVVRGKLIIE